MDLQLVETGDGGDLVKNVKDLKVIYGFQNMIYLGLMGGNLAQSTPILRDATEQAFDFWGNNLFMQGDSSIQFNSETERALNTTPLTSAGRVLIQLAVQNDLEFMRDFADVKVTVQIVSDDVLIIGIRIQQLDNLQIQDFVIIWDATKKELTEAEILTTTKKGVSIKYFDYTFDVSFE